MNVNERVHWVLVRVTTKLGGELVEWIKWEGLPWAVRCKWDWYFKYRAALLQVKYPRYEVQRTWGNAPATGKTLRQLLMQKISAKKGQVTKFRSLLHQARMNWTELFPIEDEPDYRKAVAKVARLESECKELLTQLKEHEPA
jgi:hypothetical protein